MLLLCFIIIVFLFISECGLSTPKGVGFIAGGKNATLIEHPWHCGIYKKNVADGILEQKCGGTLVSRYFVISGDYNK